MNKRILAKALRRAEREQGARGLTDLETIERARKLARRYLEQERDR